MSGRDDPRPSGSPDGDVVGTGPLSFGQERLLWLHEADDRSAAYHLTVCLRFANRILEPVLTRALARLVDRHDMLRCRYVRSADGDARQELVAGLTVPLAWRPEPASGGWPAAVESDVEQPFDLGAAPPVRGAVVRCRDGSDVLVLTMHHILSDGRSLQVIADDLTALYRAELAGAEPVLPVLPVRYQEFALAQRERLDEPAIGAHLAHWREELAGFEPLELPLDRRRPAVRSWTGSRVRFEVPAAATSALQRLAADEHCTMTGAVAAAFKALLAAYTGQRDLTICTVLDGRRGRGMCNVVGFFVNTVALRVQVANGMTFRELMRKASDKLQAARRHQEAPFERVAALAERRPGREPISDVLLVHFGERDRDAVQPTEIQRVGRGDGSVRFDLELDTTVRRGSLAGGVRYRADLFEPETMTSFARRFAQLVERLAADPDSPLDQIPLVDQTERARLLTAGRGEAGPGNSPMLHELFAEQVARMPEQVALVHAGSTLSYRELGERVNRLAHLLIEYGVEPEDLVAVVLPRSQDQVVTLLAVLTAGGAYLPVDPDYPVERVAQVLQRTRPAVLIDVSSTGWLTEHRAAAGVRRLRLDAPAIRTQLAEASPECPTDADRRSPLRSSNPAYVVHTSGSTGQPKGVVVEHRSLALFAADLRGRLLGMVGGSPGQTRLRVAQTASFSFDVSWQGQVALAFGHELHLPAEPVRRDPQAYVSYLREHCIDLVDFTPSHCEQLVEAGLVAPGMRAPGAITVAGEAVGQRLWDRLRAAESTAAQSYYGPTECTVYQTTCPLADSGRPLIGRPLYNTSVYVLDRALRPVPPGFSGELYIAGALLARGYLGQPGLSAERFVADPFGPPGSRMYRTGDLARWDAVGRLDFLGRADGQVKLRGFRIELPEIESVLSDHPDVAQVAVVVQEEQQSGDRRLVAYLVSRDGRPAPQDLRTHLAARLPSYMLPAAYVAMDELPLTKSGKLDRRALPPPEPTAGAPASAWEPGSLREEILCQLFAETLHLDRVAPDDDFFAAGGHSLLVTRLVARITSALGAELRIRDVFDRPTPARLAELLDRETNARPALTRQPRPAQIPLSYGQQRLWFIAQAEGPNSTYNIPIALRLAGPLDSAALATAVGDVVARHDALRTVFPARDGVPYQRVLDPAAAFSGWTARDVDERDLPAALAEAVGYGIDLTREPPLRAWLFRIDPETHVLLLLVHHVAADGWSVTPLQRDLAAAYAARRRATSPELPPLPIQYPDYALWQRAVLGSEADPHSMLARQARYWRETLAGLPEELSLPRDRPRPNLPSNRAEVVDFDLDPAQHRRLATLARSAHASVTMVLQGAVAVLLHRLGAGTDIPLGGVVAGRTDEVIRDVVGFFVNTQVLRYDLTGRPDFWTVLARVRETDLSAYDHQELPFEQVVELLNPPRSMARHPLFQVMLVVQPAGADGPELPGLMVTREPTILGVAKFDLTFTFWERRAATGEPAGISGRLEASADLFARRTAERYVERLQRLLTEVVADPGRSVGRIDVLTDRERLAVLTAPNDTAVQVRTETVPEAFRAQVARSPDAVAVASGDTWVTYAELDVWTDRLAYHLARHGVRLDQRVGLLMERSVATVAWLLAILKAGGAYLPLHLSDPVDRMRRVLGEAQAGLLVTDAVWAGRAAELGVPVLPAEDGSEAGTSPVPPVAPSISPRHLAYVIYTSGSTGIPKGVAVTHQNVTELAQDRRWRGAAHQRVLLHSPLAFDASTYELWVPLLSGGRVVVASPAELDVDTLARVIEDQAVSALWLTSGLFQLVAELKPGALGPVREVWSGGDVVSPTAVQAVHNNCPDVTVVNGYGPTETTTFALSYRTGPSDGDSATVLIGTPLDNTCAYILDTNLCAVPPGVVGEVYLAGSGLARGYLNRPGMTAERFVACPYAGPGERMYRTGDLARWSDQGQVEFVGRSDDQVKIRGFRIEPAEVEVALARCAGVRRAVVIVREDHPTDKRLVAYVVGDTDGADLREQVAARLPDYLVPSAVVELDRIPLTPNGKVDRRALPAPTHPHGTAGTAGPPSAPQVRLCTLFSEALGLSEVGVDDDFFALGGHSLLAIRLISRVRAALGAELTVQQLFERPTPARLAALVEGATRERQPLRPMPPTADAPLAPLQQGLWFLQQLDGYRTAYNVPLTVRLSGRLDAAVLATALSDLVVRHELLRTVFPEREGVPWQRVLPPDSVTRARLFDTTPELVESLLATERRHQFDLATEPPLRAALFRLNPTEHVLSLVFHHVAVDAWSLEPFWRDLRTAHQARSQGGPPTWRPLPVQYRDYARWHSDLLGSTAAPSPLAVRQLEFWRRALADLPEQLNLLTDRPRPSAGGLTQGELTIEWGTDTHVGLAALASDTGASMFMIVQAAVAAALTRVGAGPDIPLGTPVAGRIDEALDELVGYFVNTLVLRTDTSGDPRFRALVERVRQADLVAFGHQDVPFEWLVEQLNPVRSVTRNPLFQVLVSCASRAGPPASLGPATVSIAGERPTAAKFDLSFDFLESGGTDHQRLECRIGYSTELFDRATAERIGAVLSRLLAQVSEDPERRIGEVEVVSAHERHLVLSEWNRTEQPMPDVTVADLFEEQVRLRPDAVAVRCESETLTYQELDLAANRLAHCLVEQDAGPERVVALSLPRGCDLVVAMLAVWKSGAAYMPLDPDLPPARVDQILADASPVMTLDWRVAPAQCPATPPPRRLGSGQHPAYVIYTSGSTGRPKGVVVTHRGIVNQLLWLRGSYPLAPDQVMFARTPIGFDPSGLEIWLPLVCGASLCLATDEVATDVGRFLDSAQRGGATHAHFVPSLLAEVLPVLAERGRFLHRIFVGGEPLSADLARRAGEVVNLYGPTEATIQAVCWSGPEAEVHGAAAPIGRPVGNMRAYVLDPNLRPAPIGVTGELYLAGAQLARGYLHQPARTAERFVANPFGPAGERLYRTGDLARWRYDGVLEFAGRADAQLKIRGHRIEPGEVEAAIAAHDEVAQSAVVAREDRPGDPRLVAYVVPADTNLERLRRHLTAVLPRYLVPDDLVALERLPLTANEKLDRAALPAPERTGSGLVDPRTPGEELLTEIFAEVLGVARVGVDDDFFALGGHSLLAVRLASRIRSVLGVELTLQRLLQARSVSGLLDLVHGGDGGSDPFAALLPLRRGPDTPLFCVHPIVGLGWCYTGLVHWLPRHTPVYSLQARGIGGGGRLPERVDEMAQDYLEQIQRVQPTGPYQLFGWSFGGTVAHAMATGLQRRGERVSLLALVDSYPHRAEAREPVATNWVAELTRQHLTHGALRAIDPDRLPDIERVCANNLRLADRHVPGTFRGDVVFFAAQQERRPAHLTPGRWRDHVTGQVVVHHVEGGHYELMHPGSLAQIAGVLREAVSTAGSVAQEEVHVQPVR